MGFGLTSRSRRSLRSHSSRSPGGRRGATAARVLNVRDEGNLRFITSSGSELIDEGPATGTVPGKVRVHFVYNGDPAVIRALHDLRPRRVDQRPGQRAD